MEKIKIGQIGIGHNHGEAKMLAVRKFPELFEVVGYAEEDERWVEKRGACRGYAGLPRLSVEEVLARADAVLIESDVWDLTRYAKLCVDAGKHIHLDKPASGPLAAYKAVLDTATATNPYEDMKTDIAVRDIPKDCRYDEMMQDFYAYIQGTKQNPFSYEHDYTVQKVLDEIVGGVKFYGKNIE